MVPAGWTARAPGGSSSCHITIPGFLLRARPTPPYTQGFAGRADEGRGAATGPHDPESPMPPPARRRRLRTARPLVEPLECRRLPSRSPIDLGAARAELRRYERDVEQKYGA